MIVSLRTLALRSAFVGAGLTAVIAGIGVGSMSGCGMCLRPCPETVPLEQGSFEIVQSETRPELGGGRVEFGDASVEVSYTDANGDDWVVELSY